MRDKKIRSLVLTALFTALIVVGSIFSFPAPWNPAVPFTMATFFVILTGTLLGPMLGLSATGLYLFLGLIGLPVFAGGRGGPQIFIGPTGGFLIGYMLAAFLAGFITRLGKGTIVALIGAVLVATVAIYLPGLPWMHYKLTGMVEEWSWSSTWGRYTLPFLIGDFIKAMAVVAITKYLQARLSDIETSS